MAIVFKPNFALGESLWGTNPGGYNKNTDGPDPLYPDIYFGRLSGLSGLRVVADLVTGSERWDDAALFGGGAGPHVGNPAGSAPYTVTGFYDMSCGTATFKYTPTTASLARLTEPAELGQAQLYHCQKSRSLATTDFDLSVVGLKTSPNLELTWGDGNLNFFTPQFAWTPVAGTEYTFVMRWRCGTVVSQSPVNVTSDGFIFVSMNGATIFDIQNIPLVVSTSSDPWNLIYGPGAFGFGGLLGELYDIEVTDECTDPGAPAEPPGTYTNNSCCAENPVPPGPGSPSGTPPGSTGGAPPPNPTIIQPTWVGMCEGGAQFLSAADPTNSESWL